MFIRIQFTLLFLFSFLFNTLAQQNSEKLTETAEQNDTLTFAGSMPLFQGGSDEAFARYVQSKIIYPKDALKNHIQGTVYVQYIIEKDGKVSNVMIVPGKNLYPSIDQMVIDIVSQSPAWEPGSNNGKPVRVKKIIPVRFTIN